MNRIATLALAAIFTSTMAHGQDVPERLCGYIEFPYHYSEAHDHYYQVTPQLAKRGRPYGSLDVAEAQSIVPAPNADLNGNSQVVVSYADHPHESDIHARGYYTLTPTPCESEAPPNDGYVCAAKSLLTRNGIAYDRHGVVIGDRHGWLEEQIELERLWPSENRLAERECLNHVRADHPNVEPEKPYLWAYRDRHGEGPYYCVLNVLVAGRLSSGLHNLASYPFQGTLRGARIGVSPWDSNPYGEDAPSVIEAPSIAIYETQDNCPALPANGD